METKKGKYTPPQTQIIEIKQFTPILITSPGNGSGNLPPTGNDNNDNDWFNG